jgi:hypothetical protein
MSKYAIVAAVGFLTVATVRAQDEVIKDFSGDNAEKFIKDVLKVDFKKSEGKNLLIYSTPDGHFDVMLRSTPKKAIFFVFDYGSLKATDQKLNEWNHQFLHTHASRSKEGRLSLVASISLEAGVTLRQLSALYAEIQEERESFQKFVK